MIDVEKEYIVNENGNEEVGIEIRKDKKIVVHFPIGYHKKEYEENSIEFKHEIRKFIKILAKKQRKMEEQENTEQEKSFHMLSALKVLEDYYNYGIYKQTVVKSRANFKGRINWKQTINQKQIYVKDKTIYNHIIYDYIDYKCEMEIQKIQEYCLYIISKVIGNVFEFAYPKCIKQFSDREMLEILRKESKNTNQDIKIEMLKNLISFVKNTNFSIIENSEKIAIKYKEFEYIFQNLVDEIGIKEKEEYYPKAMYLDWTTGEQNGKVEKSFPDTIVKRFEKKLIFVLDAKYKKINNRPNEYEIFKQIRYGEYVKDKLKEQGQNNVKVINAFILPNNLSTEKQEEKQVKIEPFYATTEDKPNCKIYFVYIDMKRLMFETKHVMEQVLEKLYEYDRKNNLTNIDKSSKVQYNFSRKIKGGKRKWESLH